MKMARSTILILGAALVLALGISTAGYFIGNIMYKAKISTNLATVKGLAEREVKADVGTWDVAFEASEISMAVAYEAANAQKVKVLDFLKKSGFSETEIVPDAFTVRKSDIRDEYNRVSGMRYEISGVVSIRSNDVDKIAAAVQQVGDLVGQGVLLTNSRPNYFFTKLNDIKPEMLGEATRNARIAAEQFAKDANAKVGHINSAEQGAFNFSARDAGESGGSETSSIYKKVRVVTTISFYLND